MLAKCLGGQVENVEPNDQRQGQQRSTTGAATLDAVSRHTRSLQMAVAPKALPQNARKKHRGKKQQQQQRSPSARAKPLSLEYLAKGGRCESDKKAHDPRKENKKGGEMARGETIRW